VLLINKALQYIQLLVAQFLYYKPVGVAY
jgi:hypothetical protein